MTKKRVSTHWHQLVRSAILLGLGSLVLLPSASSQEARSVTVGAVVYEKIDFDSDGHGFEGVKGGGVGLTDDAVSGKALRCQPNEHWGGVRVEIDIKGSEDLKLAFLVKGRDLGRASLNIYDEHAKDNTTSYAPRLLDPNAWTPVVYYLDDFRYNSLREGTVNANTRYSSVRFFASNPSRQAELLLDNFAIWRGADGTPPSPVKGLKASPSSRGVQISWEPAADDVGVMGYVASRRHAGADSFVKIADIPQPGWLDTGSVSGTVEYRVLAYDFEQNLGPWSNTVRAEAYASTFVDSRTPTPEEIDRGYYSAKVKEIHSQGQGKIRKGHVCFFGDSLTEASGYSRMAQAAIGVYSQAALGYQGRTVGIGRKTVNKILDLENPEYLLVLFGTNDVKSRVPSKKELALLMIDMEAIATAGHSRGTVVLFGTIPPRGFDDPQSRPQDVFNEALLELGHQIGVPVAHIFSEIQKAGDRREFLTTDGIHWEEAGMEIAGRAWGRVMRQVEWAVRDTD